jgi:hypothetical protein
MEGKASQHDYYGDPILTRKRIADLYQRSSRIMGIRSAVSQSINHCADIIREVCKNSADRKEFRFILPSVNNPDIAVRAKAAGINPEDVVIRLVDWQEILAKTALDIKPNHSLELRTTLLPHRYNAIFSESGGFAGFAWHCKASLATTSFDIREESGFRKWFLGNLIEDFEFLWELSEPYELGDNKRILRTVAAADPIHEVLLEFGKARGAVINALRYIKRAFPDANGNGVTKEHLSAFTDSDPADCGKRLYEMEKAGFLYKLCGNGRGSDFHGRLIGRCGERVLEKWGAYYAREDRAR